MTFIRYLAYCRPFSKWQALLLLMLLYLIWLANSTICGSQPKHAVLHGEMVGSHSGADFQALPRNYMILGSAGGRFLVQVGRVGVVVPGDSWALNLREQNLHFSFHLDFLPYPKTAPSQPKAGPSCQIDQQPSSGGQSPGTAPEKPRSLAACLFTDCVLHALMGIEMGLERHKIQQGSFLLQGVSHLVHVEVIQFRIQLHYYFHRTLCHTS